MELLVASLRKIGGTLLDRRKFRGISDLKNLQGGTGFASHLLPTNTT